MLRCHVTGPPLQPGSQCHGGTVIGGRADLTETGAPPTPTPSPSVVVRDIIPAVMRGRSRLSDPDELAAGLIVFILTKYAVSSQIAELNGSWTTTITVAGPILVSLFVFSICGVLRPWRNAASDQLVEAVNTDLAAGEDRMVVHA
jgi:hypothetical protein